MKLFFDTTDRNLVKIKLFDKSDSVLLSKGFSSTINPDSALNLISKELERNNFSLKDIDSIEVAPGPGSYTGSRIGVSIANALSFALSIPVNGKDVSVSEEPQY